MQSSIQNTYKAVVLNAWKERWSEQKWTMTMRKLLQPGNNSDMFQMADVLFSQAFIGSSPNNVLLSYFNYGLKSGTFTYAAILTAISKHEDLQNITSMKYTLNFLIKYINKINQGQILEECMALCRALLLLLQWLLRNIEQYLKGVHEVSVSDAEAIIKSNCSTLHVLTTCSRTASLLTVARFEESSVWSHIETDLAVIKNAAAGHAVQEDVNKSCHCVSQLARCHNKTSAAFLLPKINGNESNHGMMINMIMLLEGEWNRMTDGDSLVQQLQLIKQICNLSTSELCLDVIRACMMGFMGSINGQMKHKWCSILFLILPQHLNRMKSALAVNIVGPDMIVPAIETNFEGSMLKAMSDLLQYDGLLDMIDQVCDNSDCIGILLDQFLTYKLLKESDVAALKSKRASIPRLSQMQHTHSVDPNVIMKYEATARQLLTVIDTTDYISKQENLLSTLIQMSSNFSIILASAFVSQNVQNFAQKLMLYNNIVKSSSGESVKSAQLRCQLFDLTFFLVCQIAHQYGKALCLSSLSETDEDKPFLYHWMSIVWPDDRCCSAEKDVYSKVALDPDDGRVQILINALCKGREQSPSLKKLHEFCVDVPKAMIEIIKAWHYGVVSVADVFNACDVICNGIFFAVRLGCLLAVEKYSHQVPQDVKDSKILPVMKKMINQAPKSSQEVQNEKLFAMFKNIAEILLSDSKYLYLFHSEDKDKIPVEKSDVFTADVLLDIMVECRQVGWVDQSMLRRLEKILKQAGPKWFCHQLVLQVLMQTRKDLVERTVSVVWSLFMLDIESLTICLLRHEIPHFLTDEEDHMLLSAPAGNALAQLAVSCLGIVLHNISLQQKACLLPSTQKEKLAHQLLVSGTEAVFSQQSHTRNEGGPTKLRRLFSSTAEHDLAASAFSSILGIPSESANAPQSKHTHVREPVLRALSFSLDVMHISLNEGQPGPHIDFAIYFVYLASCCGELVSQAVLQLMPLSMVTELTTKITAQGEAIKTINFDKDFDNLTFALSVSDLGHPFSRRVAAKAVCQINLAK